MYKRMRAIARYGCLFCFTGIISCSKSDDDGPSDPCDGVNIAVSTSTTESDKCGATGTITVTATGSTSFTYKLNSSGTYQAANVFNAVEAGTHTVYAKNSNGCESSAQVTVNALANGTHFTAVKNLVNARCVSCHVAGHTSGIDFTIDCNIANRGAQIKTVAVDQELMPQGGPPLSATEKKVITDWLDAGGKTSN